MPSLKIVLAIALLFIAYFATALLGLSFYPQNFSTYLWPPAGIALAALLLFGYSLWPGVALGALAVAISIGLSPIAAIFSLTGATLQALVGTWLLRDYFKIEYSFGRLYDTVVFLCVTIGIALIHALLGSAGLVIDHEIPRQAFSNAFGERWVANTLSMLVFTPLILTWFTFGKTIKRPVQISERLLFILFLCVVDTLVFASPYGSEHRYTAYLAVFPLMWSTLRFGPRGKTTAIFLTACIAMIATVFGRGPFAMDDIVSALISVQTFVATVTIIFLLFAAVEEELTRARAELEEYVDKLEHALQETRDGKPSDLPETELSQ
ncbi:MAG TPA: MASE1 domain-containing protein [Candidatus Paceibacterota bacterium]|nr:MASE1 domain-containing protein [Candidatus Paceibacterota bacterium]